jgi:hypothetical protein
MRGKLIALQGRLSNSLVSFNTHFSIIDSKVESQGGKEDKNKTVNEIELIDNFRTLCLKITECIFCTDAHGTFTNIACKIKLNKFKMI